MVPLSQEICSVQEVAVMMIRVWLFFTEDTLLLLADDMFISLTGFLKSRDHKPSYSVMQDII
jgi:hypothetical protein